MARVLDASVARSDAEAKPRSVDTSELTSACVRALPEDFVVDELAPPRAEDPRGGHLHLRVRKRATTTLWVAAGIARHFGIASRAVGYAGLKDRNAVTSQWFSVPWRGAPPLTLWYEPGTCVLELRRVAAALRPGDLVGNRFQLRLRDVADPAQLEQRLQALAEAPRVPNYFGPQRYGTAGANLVAISAWATGRAQPRDRTQRGLWLSTARALLFDCALADRVAGKDWALRCAGDALMHGLPAGPLWGKGRPLPSGAALTRAQATWRAHGAAAALLEREGVHQGLRPYVLPITELQWRWAQPQIIELSFRLPPGAYATSVLRELVVAMEAAA